MEKSNGHEKILFSGIWIFKSPNFVNLIAFN